MFKKTFILASFLLLLFTLSTPRAAKAEGDGPEFVNLPLLVFSDNKEGAYHLIKLYQIVFGNIPPSLARGHSHMNLQGLIFFYEQNCNDRTPDVCLREFVPNPPCTCPLPSAPPPAPRPMNMNMTMPMNMTFPSGLTTPPPPIQKDKMLAPSDAGKEAAPTDEDDKAKNQDPYSK